MKYLKICRQRTNYGFTTKKLVLRYRRVYQAGNHESIGIVYNMRDMNIGASMNERRINKKRDVYDDYKDWGRYFMETRGRIWFNEV
jgi:hypothetical protein